MSKEEILEIKKLLTQALILIDEILSREYEIPKNEEKEIEEINWIKLGNWEWASIYYFPSSFIKEIKEKGYITKNGYLYKLKKNRYGMKVIRKKIIEKL
ncbi:MAG: hypothetical protein QW272_05200 [Candidatus Methanomethylicaceae archaeon]